MGSRARVMVQRDTVVLVVVNQQNLRLDDNPDDAFRPGQCPTGRACAPTQSLSRRPRSPTLALLAKHLGDTAHVDMHDIVDNGVVQDKSTIPQLPKPLRTSQADDHAGSRDGGLGRRVGYVIGVCSHYK